MGNQKSKVCKLAPTLDNKTKEVTTFRTYVDIGVNQEPTENNNSYESEARQLDGQVTPAASQNCSSVLVPDGPPQTHTDDDDENTAPSSCQGTHDSVDHENSIADPAQSLELDKRLNFIAISHVPGARLDENIAALTTLSESEKTTLTRCSYQKQESSLQNIDSLHNRTSESVTEDKQNLLKNIEEENNYVKESNVQVGLFEGMISPGKSSEATSGIDLTSSSPVQNRNLVSIIQCEASRQHFLPEPSAGKETPLNTDELLVSFESIPLVETKAVESQSEDGEAGEVPCQCVKKTVVTDDEQDIGSTDPKAISSSTLEKSCASEETKPPNYGGVKPETPSIVLKQNSVRRTYSFRPFAENVVEQIAPSKRKTVIPRYRQVSVTIEEPQIISDNAEIKGSHQVPDAFAVNELRHRSYSSPDLLDSLDAESDSLTRVGRVDNSTENTHSERKDNLKLFLKEYRKPLIQNSRRPYTLEIRRERLLSCAFDIIKQPSFEFGKHPSIVFLGEPAIDGNGPFREFFRILMKSVACSTVFEGHTDRRTLSYDIGLFAREVYYWTGVLVAWSILHGGRGPNCIHPFVFSQMFGGVSGEVSISDLPDLDDQNKLNRLSSCTNDYELTAICSETDMFQWLQANGVRDLRLSVSQMQALSQELVKHHLYNRVLAPIKQFKSGLNILGLLDVPICQRQKDVLYQLLVYQPNPLVAEDIKQLCSRMGNLCTDPQAKKTRTAFFQLLDNIEDTQKQTPVYRL